MAFWYLLPLFLLLSFSISGAQAAIFTLKNNCKNTIWPGIQPGSGRPVLNNGGLELKPGKSVNIQAPSGWSGRLWGRRGCSFDDSGKGTCLTGDCGGFLQCAGAGGVPPTTLAEFTLDSPMDFYDVSLVDGYDLPVSIVPVGGGSGVCKPTRCISDLNRSCPRGLQVRDKKKRVVACKSACMAFNTPQYCCTEEFGSPNTCKPTNYSKAFKASCPTAYSYAYDDATSTFTCKGANYLITFC
ncbi:pathogenesis-related thaumatin-like protein 3.5 [Macadamia integrifolia]|uniref:pathogenesis-related thaumatin-like protein 3.5 n=1 Tax=Macadamia integrifolia TaxID=60698 RepID=UPI001C4EA0B8|nr:pathogenesis-related thaumatin-like protein 3.5 [Macadamia integrifolia]